MQVSIAEILLIGGLAGKALYEVFRNKQQDKDRVTDNKANQKAHARIETVVADLSTDLKKLDAYVTNGVDSPGGGLAAKFVTRGECRLRSTVHSEHLGDPES